MFFNPEFGQTKRAWSVERYGVFEFMFICITSVVLPNTGHRVLEDGRIFCLIPGGTSEGCHKGPLVAMHGLLLSFVPAGHDRPYRRKCDTGVLDAVDAACYPQYDSVWRHPLHSPWTQSQ